MTSAEKQDYLELRQRLYGGPLDNEQGDIVTMKADIAEIKNSLRDITSFSKAITSASRWSLVAASGTVGIFVGLHTLGLF